MADVLNSVAVATGSLVVSGTLTSFVAAEYDLFILNGAVAVIASRDSASRITLKQPWAGDTITGATGWTIANTGPYWQSTVATNKQLSDLLSKFEVGPVKWDASGPLSGRGAYDGQAKDFVFLSVSPTPFTLFVKLSSAIGDWSAGQTIWQKADSTIDAEAARDIAQTAAATASDNATVTTQQATKARTAADEIAATGTIFSTFSTRDLATKANIKPDVGAIRLLGYAAAGDGGGGEYKRAASQPSGGLYFNTADGAAWVFASLLVSPQSAGGADDGSTANDAAWTAAKSLGRPVSLPRAVGAGYRFAAPLLLAGVVADPALGTTIISPAGSDFHVSFKTTRALTGKFRVGDGDTADYSYQYTADHYRPRRERSLWATASDIDRERYEKIDPSVAMTHWSVPNGSDAWAPTTPDAVADHEVTFNLQADNVIRASLLPVRGGQDLRWARSGGDYQGGLLIRTTAGYYFIRAGLTGAAQMMTKLVGQAATEFGAIGWPGISTDGAYYSGNAFWGARILDNRRFCLLINAYKAFGAYPVQGEIIEAGPAWFGDRAQAVSAAWLNRVHRTIEAGGALASLLLIGDSTVETIHGGLDAVIAETLDAVRGIRVTAVNNYAQGGKSSYDQWIRLSTLGIPPGTTLAVILLTRNDISGGGSTDGFSLVYISKIVDFLTTAGVKVVLCVPFGAYGRGPAGGSGVNVVNAENSARTQMMLAGIGGAKGVKVLDLNDLSGPAIGEFAHHAYAECMWRDNLHESAFGYKVYGTAIGMALAGLCLEPMTQQVQDGALPATPGIVNTYGLRNNWTQSGDPLTYCVDRRGDQAFVSLFGQLAAGDRAAAQTIYRVPPNLRPIRGVYAGAAYSDATGVSMQVNPQGDIIVRGMASTGSFVRLDGLSYPVR